MKFSFERAKAPGSTNKAKRAVFDNISSVVAHNEHTVILVLDKADSTLPFRLGENTAVILHPNTAASAATKPVGTGPYRLENWAKGSAVTLVKWDGHRDADKVEVDVVIENAAGQLVGVEVKASATVRESDLKGLRKLAGLAGNQFQMGILLYDGDETMPMGGNIWAAPLATLWG